MGYYSNSAPTGKSNSDIPSGSNGKPTGLTKDELAAILVAASRPEARTPVPHEQVQRLLEANPAMRGKLQDPDLKCWRTCKAAAPCPKCAMRNAFVRMHLDPPGRGINSVPIGESIRHEWEPPIPFGEVSSVAPFPLDSLPKVLREWSEAQATALQVPVDMPALTSLVVCGAGIARRFEVIIREGWREPTNLFAAIALPVGERKSALVREALAPVLDVEGIDLRRMMPVRAEALNKARLLEARLKSLATRAAKENDSNERRLLEHEAAQVAKELAAHVVPAEPRYCVDDATPEALAKAIGAQGSRLLQISPEGTPFEIAKGRYSDAPNFDIYLKGHAGDDHRVDRTERPAIVVTRPALSLCVVAQPDVIRGLAEHACMKARGFLARFLYALPKSRLGDRLVEPVPVPGKVSLEYHRVVSSLWQLNAGAAEPTSLVFSSEANEVLADFERWLEPQLREGEALSHLGGWANKLAGAAARLAGICHMVEATAANRQWDHPIGDETVASCVQLARTYLISHAQAAFFMMGSRPELADAKRLLTWLRSSVVSVVSVVGGPVFSSRRDIHVKAFGGNLTLDHVDKVINLLVSHNYLRPMEDTTGSKGKPGRPPSPKFEVNPLIAKK